MFGLLLAFAVEAGWMLWFRLHVSSMCSLGSLLRFPRVALGNSAGCVAVA